MALTFANKITIVRIVAVPFFISAALYYSAEREYLRFVVLGIFLFAVISDVIDGYIARTRDQKTKAGAILDPLADKLLLISAFSCLGGIGAAYPPAQFPVWLIVAVISRDVVLLLGSMLIYIMNGDLLISPTIWGKASTFFQVSAVLGLLLHWDFAPVLWYATLILAVVSGVDYIRRGIKVLNVGAA
jgi:cardiolipin synthase (CMP-forming)